MNSDLEALFYFHGGGLYITGAALGRSTQFHRGDVRVTLSLPEVEHVSDSPRFGMSARRASWNESTGEIIAAMVDTFEVRVQVEPHHSESLDAVVARAFPLAVASADLFLASARTFAGQYWLPPWHESPEVATYGMLVHAGTYDEVDVHARWMLPFAVYGISPDRAASAEGVGNVFAKTGAGDAPATEEMLFADARAALHSGRRDTAGAVLLAAMAAEVKIKRTLLRNAERGLDAALDNPRDLAVATGQLLGKPMKTAVGKSLAEEEPQLYRDVTEQLFPLRNDVVHRGSRPEFDAATAALETTERLFAWLESV